MPIQVIVPVRSFRLGKKRLAPMLSEPERGQLARDLADHVTQVVTKSGLVPTIVTPDQEVARWARNALFETVEDPGSGLNAAAAMGLESALFSGSQWLIVHSDLPLLTPADIDVLATGLEDEGAVLAPSSDGGTSAIGASASFTFSFGVGSFHRHLSRLRSARIVARTGLLLDVDSPLDLRAAKGRL